MYKFLGSCLLATVLFTACNSGSAKKSNTAAAPAPLPGITTKQPASGNVAPVVTNTTTATGSAAAGTNPPHGQPGHRCDVAVGAPLNGQASPSVVIPGNKPQNNVSIQPSPANTTLPVPANTTGNGVKLNPPHGQPGHDCSVQVGQPLKS